MSRYTGPAFKQSRRVGFSLSETGKELKRPGKPGVHGNKRSSKPTEYSIQLIEKQKVRFMYGMNEKQFRKFFDKAAKMSGIHGENFLKLLETRLDNVVYRMNIASTRRASRQLVNHGHILVNGKKVDIPSYLVKPGDVISVREKSMDKKVINESLERNVTMKEYVTFDKNKKTGVFVRMPERAELTPEINESLIVEFYSR